MRLCLLTMIMHTLLSLTATTNSTPLYTTMVTGDDNNNYQIVLIDFGKATECEKGRMLYLTNEERLEYQRRFPHIAPEVREC